MEKENNIILQAKEITKYYGGICALDKVNLELMKGEILGLVGDNGAGKSTLIKILSGVIPKDSGEIYINGEKVEINFPLDARKLGIETIYQDLALLDKLNVPSNMFLAREIIYNNFFGKVFKLLNFKRMYKETETILKTLNINIGDIRKEVRFFSGGQRQAVCLSKLVYWGKKVAILDEPTAALGINESRNALKLISSLKEHGISVIVISHNLQHIFSIVDRIMILRRGKRVDVKSAHEVNADEIVSLITGSKFVEKV